jgi:hypothetical protein
VFDGFAFVFSSGADIKNVVVDPGSQFLPITGGLTFDSTDIWVNFAGEAAPAIGAQLTLDVTAGASPPIPEASSWAMLLVGFAMLGSAAYRRTSAA